MEYLHGIIYGFRNTAVRSEGRGGEEGGGVDYIAIAHFKKCDKKYLDLPLYNLFVLEKNVI